MKGTHQSEKGYVAIAIVLLLSAIILGLMVTITALGIGEGQEGLALEMGTSTLHFVEGCMQDALLHIRANASYTGGSISRPDGVCTITVSPVGSTYTVTATTTAAAYIRTIQAVVTRGSSALSLSSWREQ